MILVYVTYADEKTARKVTEHLLKGRLIACYNLVPVNSGYWWQGKIQNEDEFVSILKTIDQNWNKLTEEILKIHPAEVPCILKLQVEANEEYENWVRGECR